MASKKSKSIKKKSKHGVSYLFTDTTVTVNYQSNGVYKTRTALAGTPEYEAVKQAVVKGKVDDLPKIIAKVEEELAQFVAKFPERYIKFHDGVLRIDGVEVPPDLNKAITAHVREGVPYMPLVNFFRRLKRNPSRSAVRGLWRFLKVNKFTITPDGHFVAYKGVGANFKDLYSGKFDNTPGRKVVMDRDAVVEDPSTACAAGLHVAGYEYAHNHYGAGEKRVMIEVLVNPKDVVSVPYDDHDQKMRVCAYKVLSVSTEEFAGNLHPHSDDDSDDSDDDDYDGLWDQWHV